MKNYTLHLNEQQDIGEEDLKRNSSDERNLSEIEENKLQKKI